MTKKRWMVLASLLAAGVCLTLAVLALLPPRPGVTKANFDRIEEGMTLDEINTILGRSPDNVIEKNNQGEIWQYWTDYDGEVWILLGNDSTLSDKRWIAYEGTFLQKVRQWLRLP
jgi:hypothetical protein